MFLIVVLFYVTVLTFCSESGIPGECLYFTLVLSCRPVSGPAAPRVQRLSSAEELKQVTSLLCTDVPAGYNDRSILTRHFAKFGTVVKVSCNKAKNNAAVHFADHVSQPTLAWTNAV